MISHPSGEDRKRFHVAFHELRAEKCRFLRDGANAGRLVGLVWKIAFIAAKDAMTPVSGTDTEFKTDEWYRWIIAVY